MQSATFGLKALGLLVFVAILSLPFLYQSGCRPQEKETLDLEDRREELKARYTAVYQKLAETVQALEPVGIGPWASRGRLSEVAAAERQRLRSRSLSLLTIQRSIADAAKESELLGAGQQLEAVENEVANYAATVEPFRTLWDEDLTLVSEMFQRVRRCNESLGRLIEDSVDTSAVSVPMRNTTRSLEDAVRFWSDSMAERLRPRAEGRDRQRQLKLRDIALGSLKAIEQDLQALEDPILRAGLMNDRLRQIVLGTQRRLSRALEVESASPAAIAARRSRLEEEVLPRLAPLRRELLARSAEPDFQDAIEALIRDINEIGAL
jgi:hypothetical protein